MNQRHNLPMLRLADPIPRYIIGTGVQRRIAYKKEATSYVLAGTATGQRLRRVNFGLTLGKDTFTSNEKASHQQDQDMRHGFIKPAGTIGGELSPLTYADWHDSLLRRARTAVANITGLTLTIAVSGTEYTITATAGPSFLTSGLKRGMVVRITAGAFNAANLNKNIVIRLVTATVITGKALNGSALVAEGPIATATMAIPGKYSFMPKTAQLDESYTIEDLHATLAVPKSEAYYGCKMNSAKVTIPASGIATIDWDILGYNMQRADAEYFASGSLVAETSTGLLASNTGMMFAGNLQYSTITSADFMANGNLSSGPVVGANVSPAVFFDKFQASGNMSVYFEDGVLRDAFIDETTIGIVIVVAADNSASADFISYMFPKCKLTSAGKDDPNTGIQQGMGWKALYNVAGGAGLDTEQTTMAYQDSAA